MDKRLLRAGLLIVLALTAFSVIRWRLQTPPQETPQRLELVRTSLGRFTLPSLESIHNNTTSTYLPVDLDGDGAPEYVFPLGYRRTGSRIAPLRAVSLWTDFNSAPNELPVEVVFPAIGGVDPALLPLKELAGLDRQSGELLRLTRRDGQWRVERL
ncbi:MAG: hypothetical protein NZ556_09100 [Fimbriimonadales bacterium]|nr:hypothetical protein [Fimbriimonadales bacterium]